MFDVIKRSVNTNLNKPLDTLITEKSTETNGKIDSKASQTSVTSMDTKVGVTSDAAGTSSTGTIFSKMNKLLTDWDTARAAKIDTIATDVTSLKTSVVNGKQAVVNAINGSLGYVSGLTTNHPFSDYAWWIQNKVNGVKDAGFERMMRMYAAGHFAVETPPAIPYSKNISVSSVFSHKNTAGDKSYYSYSLTLPSAGTYLLINSVETVRADTRGYLTSVGSMTQIAAYSYYYMSGRYYYGSLFKVTNPGIFYNSAGYSGMSSYPRIDEVIELTPQSLQWLAGTIN